MLFGLFAAAAAAAAAAAQQPAPHMADDPDLRCMVALSIALGRMEDGTIEAAADEKSSIVALVMYFVGKIDARLPDFDYATEVTRLVRSPDYADTKLPDDLERCSDEAAARGQTLIELGEQLKDLAPLMEGTRAG